MTPQDRRKLIIANPERINDFIDDWHMDLVEDMSLAQYMGLSQEEYNYWVMTNRLED